LALILNIETATTACSVSFSDGEKIIGIKEMNNGYSHSENLHVFIAEIMKEKDIFASDIEAVAVSKGPGSYTGLRIGVSAAKGFAYAMSIPLIGINTLESMTKGIILREKADAVYCPMLDARRMEVYCAAYDKQLNEILPTNAKVIDEKTIFDFQSDKPLIFFGDGVAKCASFIKQLPGARIIPDVYPSAQYLALLSAKAFHEKRFEDVAYFEPYYLKDFFTNTPQKE
jgi:tRNA threonylcarbamoyladenosine biosynthesis protein TsaB